MPYEEVEIEDMEWSDELQAFTYACPCGDVFQITKVRFAGRGRGWGEAVRGLCTLTARSKAARMLRAGGVGGMLPGLAVRAAQSVFFSFFSGGGNRGRLPRPGARPRGSFFDNAAPGRSKPCPPRHRLPRRPRRWTHKSR